MKKNILLLMYIFCLQIGYSQQADTAGAIHYLKQYFPYIQLHDPSAWANELKNTQNFVMGSTFDFGFLAGFKNAEKFKPIHHELYSDSIVYFEYPDSIDKTKIHYSLHRQVLFKTYVTKKKLLNIYKTIKEHLSPFFPQSLIESTDKKDLFSTLYKINSNQSTFIQITTLYVARKKKTKSLIIIVINKDKFRQ